MNDLSKEFPITNNILNGLRHILYGFKSSYIILYDVKNYLPSPIEQVGVIDITITFIKREDLIDLIEDSYMITPGKGMSLNYKHQYSIITEEHINKAMFNLIDNQVSIKLLETITLVKDNTIQIDKGFPINSISFRTMCETREIKI